MISKLNEELKNNEILNQNLDKELIIFKTDIEGYLHKNNTKSSELEESKRKIEEFRLQIKNQKIKNLK